MSPSYARTSIAAVVAALTLAGCSLSSSGDGGSTPGGTGSSGGSSTAKNTTVTLVTHDSWVADKALLAKFTAQTGLTVKVIASGDAGQLANKLVLTKGNPTGDVTFGVDNTFATRVVDSGALESYEPKDLPASATEFALSGDGSKDLTPIDFGDVCVNVDNAWFTKKGQTPPANFADLLKPEYKNQFVTPAASSSSPGMAFLLATIAKYGTDGWQNYWKQLMANGTKLTSGWSDAWSVDYTAGGGNGSRPIVLSYNTSPADTIKDGKATTSALLDTCFQSVEYAGVLAGAKNPDGAKAFIDFMLGEDFQKALPEAMYVFPVDTSIPLPAAWQQAAKVPATPLNVDPGEITKNRDTWLRDWQDVTS